MSRRRQPGINAAAWCAGQSFHQIPAARDLEVLEAAAELRRNVRAAIVEGGTVSATTIGTADKPSIVETPGGEDAARFTAELPGDSK